MLPSKGVIHTINKKTLCVGGTSLIPQRNDLSIFDHLIRLDFPLEIIKGWWKFSTCCKALSNECETASKVMLVQSANLWVKEALWRWEYSNFLWENARLSQIEVKAWFFFVTVFTRWVIYLTRDSKRLREIKASLTWVREVDAFSTSYRYCQIRQALK